MSFLPNMSKQEMAEYDKRRGQGDVELFHHPTLVTAKKPWQNLNGTHKAQLEEEKPMTETVKAISLLKGINNNSVSQASHAASQRASQRQQGRKERQIEEYHMTKKGAPLDEKFEGLKKFVMTSAPAPSGASLPHGSQTGVASAGGQTGMSPAHSALSAVPKPSGPPPIPSMKSVKEDDDDDFTDKLFGKSLEDQKKDFIKHMDDFETEYMSKALNSKSMAVLRPNHMYDPFNVMRSATTSVVHKADIAETNTPNFRDQVVYKSCVTHGISYRSEVGCHPCNVFKSNNCSHCGSAMTKTAGGSLACSHGH